MNCSSIVSIIITVKRHNYNSYIDEKKHFVVNHQSIKIFIIHVKFI